MSRRFQSCVALATLGLAAAILFGAVFSGCGPGKGARTNRPPSGDTRQPLLKGWKKPALALIVSGEQHGHLEPCGCTAESRIGGFAHRADLIRRLREKRKWNVAGVELGGMIAGQRGPAIAELRKQDELKLQAILSGLTQMGYVAAGLGKPELQSITIHQKYFLLTQSNVLADAKTDLPFVAANVDLAGSGPRKWHAETVGDTTVAVTAVFGKQFRRTILPTGTQSEVVIADPEKALPSVIAAMKQAKPDLMVLLAFADKKTETRKLAKQFPDFDLIVTAGGQGDGTAEPERVGKTAVVDVGIKGKHVGVVGFYPDAEKPADRLRFELVELDADRFADDPAMHELMKRYQKAIGDNLSAVFADTLIKDHPSGATFVGVDSCKGCHTKAYNHWRKTKHAKAYESLKKGRKGEEKNWISRHLDPECLACHVTGWHPQKVNRYGSGFLVEALARSAGKPNLFKNLRGQQCENCHGPGSRHVDLEHKWRDNPDPTQNEAVRRSRQAMKLTLDGIKQTRLCYQCHDLDNSPNFDFDKYWKDVEHKGKD
ncbi:MAG: multiheme c-type cytochrome [Planctomycetaceae bacterium]